MIHQLYNTIKLISILEYSYKHSNTKIFWYLLRKISISQIYLYFFNTS